MTEIGRLPDRFPVGTRYVVEGAPDRHGEFLITARYLVLPNGTHVSLPPGPGRPRRRRGGRKRRAAGR